jgi:hypothetical protein
VDLEGHVTRLQRSSLPAPPSPTSVSPPGATVVDATSPGVSERCLRVDLAFKIDVDRVRIHLARPAPRIATSDPDMCAQAEQFESRTLRAGSGDAVASGARTVAKKIVLAYARLGEAAGGSRETAG